MLFVRGIKGKLKLNPALKLWGGLFLLLVLIFGGLVHQILGIRDRAAACEARGGVWIGGALRSSFCAQGKKGTQW